ncbi:MAG: retention module-containing protein, partial [Pseudomonadales bacterium]
MIIGRISLLQGRAQAIKPDGTTRELSLGDVVHSDEVVSVAPGGQLEIELMNGEVVNVAGGDSFDGTKVSTAAQEDVADDGETSNELTAEQLAVLEGDFNPFGDTAAGPQAGAGAGAGPGGNEGSSFVRLSRGGEVAVDSGLDFETTGQIGHSSIGGGSAEDELSSPVLGAFFVFDNVGPQDSLNPRALASGESTDDDQPTFQGTGGVAGSVIRIYDQGVVIASSVVDPTGTWEIEVTEPLEPGNHVITVTQQIPGLPESLPSTPFVIEVQVAPVIESITDDVGATTEIIEGAKTDDASPTIAGTARPNTLIKLYNGDEVIGSVLSDADGRWSLEPELPLLQGTYAISVTSTQGGVESVRSQVRTFELDMPGSKAPSIEAVIDDTAPVTGPITKDTGVTNDV